MQLLNDKPDFFSFQREGKRQRWTQAAEAFVSRNRDLVLAHFISTSKRNPTLIASFLMAEKEADFQEWNESCLKCYVAPFSFRERLVPPQFHHCLEVSAHAVQRMLQRTGLGLVAGQFDRQSLLDELRPLANWAGFLTILVHVFRLPQGVVLFPVLPSRHGLYLCNAVTKLGAGISVRTFIGNHQLRTEQIALRDRLLEEMEWAAGVPYFMFPRGGQPLTLALSLALQAHVARLHDIFLEWARTFAGAEEATSLRLVQLLVDVFEQIRVDGDKSVHQGGLQGLGGYACFERYFRIAQNMETHRNA